MEGPQKYIVFYSWQSDCSESRDTIKKALNTAKELLASKNQPVDIIIDEGTSRVPGMPQIDTTVLSKIMGCDVFVADITPVHAAGEDLLPNPNVLLELGFAMGVVGMSKIILLAKRGDWNPKDLPFDINHKRIDFFKNANGLKNLGEWITSCIEISEEYGKSDDRMRRMEHDIKKFREFNEHWTEDVFVGSFNTIYNSSHFNDYELDIWYAVRDWLLKSENLFITTSIKEAASKLLTSLCDFLQFTVMYWSTSVSRWCSDIPKDEDDDRRIKLQQFYEWETGDARHSSNYQQREQTIVKGLNKYIPAILDAYSIFRSMVKNELYV